MRFQALAYLRRDQEWFRNLAEWKISAQISF
jgi:hypothetical protein